MKRIDNNINQQKFLRAKERVDNIKSFYKHLSFYLLVNFFFIGRRIYKDIAYGNTIFEAFLEVSNYRFFFWWGLIVILHAIGTFGFLNLFSKEWEERKIKEFMKNQKH